MDRRHFVMTGSLALGAGALPSTAARAATVPTLRGPYVDLTTGKGNMLTLARMNSNFDEGKVKYGSASGTVFGVRPGEAIRDLFGAEVVSSARAWKQPDGSYRVLHRETVLYTDLKSGDVLGEFQNPYTNERVKVVDVVNDPWNETFEEFERAPPSFGGKNQAAAPARKPMVLPWRELGAGLIGATRYVNLYYPSSLQPDKWPRESPGKFNQVTEVFAYIVPLKDVQDEKNTSLVYTGTWSRSTPWLPWMLMGQAPGHCWYETTMQGFDTLDGFKPHILAYMKKTHPQMLEPPTRDSWSKPNLSSLEVYARDQKPAPARP
jgi:Protein of unknown function (DUF1838)